MKCPKASGPVYEIRVEGELGDMWVDWFGSLSIRKESTANANRIITVLYGPIVDQPAMHAVLNKICDLNLTLVSINRCETEERSR